MTRTATPLWQADMISGEAKQAWDGGLPVFVYLPPSGLDGSELSSMVSAVMAVGWELRSSAVGATNDGLSDTAQAMFTFMRPSAAYPN